MEETHNIAAGSDSAADAIRHAIAEQKSIIKQKEILKAMTWDIQWQTSNPGKSIVETREITTIDELVGLVKEPGQALGFNGDEAVVVIYPKHHSITITDPCNL